MEVASKRVALARQSSSISARLMSDLIFWDLKGAKGWYIIYLNNPFFSLVLPTSPYGTVP